MVKPWTLQQAWIDASLVELIGRQGPRRILKILFLNSLFTGRKKKSLTHLQLADLPIQIFPCGASAITDFIVKILHIYNAILFSSNYSFLYSWHIHKRSCINGRGGGRGRSDRVGCTEKQLTVSPIPLFLQLFISSFFLPGLACLGMLTKQRMVDHSIYAHV